MADLHATFEGNNASFDAHFHNDEQEFNAQIGQQYYGRKGDKGDQGDPGKSAYQLAVEQGFDGTELEWLASLKGDPGDNYVLTVADKAEIAAQAAAGLNETDPTVPAWAKQPQKPSYTATEVGALPSDTVIPATVTEQTVSGWGFTKNTGTYSKPNGGIPKSDLASDVQTSLGKADTALQTHQDISGKLDTTGNAFRTVSIPWGKVDSTSTSTVYTATVPGITELRDGVTVMLMNGVVTSASGFTININNLGARPVYSTLSAASRATTLFNIGYTLLLVYNTHRDTTNFPDGVWDAYYGYDSNTNTIGYQLRTNSLSLPMASVTYRYRLLFTSADGTHFVPSTNSTSTNATASRTVCQTPIDPFGRIVYYGTTASVSAGSRPSAAYLWSQYVMTLGYAFNRTGAALVLDLWKPVYIKCAPQTDGSAIIDADNPYVQTLPTTADGKIYIFLGIAVSATTVEVTQEHPVYAYRNNAVRKWTGLEAELDALIARIEALET